MKTNYQKKGHPTGVNTGGGLNGYSTVTDLARFLG